VPQQLVQARAADANHPPQEPATAGDPHPRAVSSGSSHAPLGNSTVELPVDLSTPNPVQPTPPHQEPVTEDPNTRTVPAAAASGAPRSEASTSKSPAPTKDLSFDLMLWICGIRLSVSLTIAGHPDLLKITASYGGLIIAHENLIFATQLMKIANQTFLKL
jgi:hypothetical protein